MSTTFKVLPLSKCYKYPNQLLSSDLSWTFSHPRVEVKILVQYYLNVLYFRICKYSCHSKKLTLVGFPFWQYPQEWQQWQLLKKVEVIEVRSEIFCFYLPGIAIVAFAEIDSTSSVEIQFFL